MSNRARLAKLESHTSKLVYPSFSDMYDLQTKAEYNNGLVKHNRGLDVESLNILHLEDMYNG